MVLKLIYNSNTATMYDWRNIMASEFCSSVTHLKRPKTQQSLLDRKTEKEFIIPG